MRCSRRRTRHNDVNVVSIECMPRRSWTFWCRHGFERYGDLSEKGQITARRILSKFFDILPELPSVETVVRFYPEAATYGCGKVPPLSVHRLRGGRLDDGTIMLERRVIGLCDDEPERKDLAVWIEVDGELRCFCKAKYNDAEETGITHDWNGGAFYVDVIEPRDA